MQQAISLDPIDWTILAELQANGALTNVELARRVGLTPPPCLRRVQALHAAGFIENYRAVLNARRLGYAVECFALVHLASQAEADVVLFKKRIAKWHNIRECWALSGDYDFLMRCVTVDIPSLQTFISDLTALPNVRNVRTALALDKVKDEGAVPVPNE